MGELDEKLVEKSESQSGSVLWNSFRRLSLYFSYLYSMYEASATPLVRLGVSQFVTRTSRCILNAPRFIR
jgi:hypothetical protein